MVDFRHTGIYVKDLQKMADFYKSVFSMHVICENFADSGPLYDDLLSTSGASVHITKLITDYGKESHHGDMIELIQVDDTEQPTHERKICDIGLSHVAFGVTDMTECVNRLRNRGGVSLLQFTR